MKRVYDIGILNETPMFFVGKEVENTVAKNKQTLFCHGKLTLQDIIEKLKEIQVENVYLNSNHTTCASPKQKIDELTKLGYFVTLEIELSKFENFSNHEKFIPFVSVRMQDVCNNKNLTIKIDDVDFDYSNPGIWAFRLDELPQHTFNDWSVYKEDSII